MKRAALAVLSVVALCTLSTASTAATDTSASSSQAQNGIGTSGTDQYLGQFTYDVPIKVAPFHGLEPTISMHYASGSSNGFLGLGWTLSGISSITRAGPRKGTPTYGKDDMFLLDGVPLVRCVDLAAVVKKAPRGGCAKAPPSKGGSTYYTTETESYLRIERHDSVEKGKPVIQWEITAQNGTVLTFVKVSPTAKAYRWGLQSAVDTHGNKVSYAWQYDTQDAYIGTISYDGTVVTFHRKKRPDPISFATGTAAYGQTNSRLAAISVSVDGAVARAYGITYDLTGRSKNSVIHSIQEYGKGAAVVQGVASGPSLPALTFGYQTEGGLSFAHKAWSKSFCKDGILDNSDIDGNGKEDLVCRMKNGDIEMAVSAGNGTFTTVLAAKAFCPNPDNDVRYSLDWPISTAMAKTTSIATIRTMAA